MKIIDISGNGLSGFVVVSLELLMLSTKVLSYSNSPIIITDTFTIEKQMFLKESWNVNDG